jgi:hypothetical protein
MAKTTSVDVEIHDKKTIDLKDPELLMGTLANMATSLESFSGSPLLTERQKAQLNLAREWLRVVVSQMAKQAEAAGFAVEFGDQQIRHHDSPEERLHLAVDNLLALVDTLRGDIH